MSVLSKLALLISLALCLLPWPSGKHSARAREGIMSFEFPEGVAKQEQLSSGARQGRNDFGKISYGGPCPPPGKPHRYFFKLYALDAKLGLKTAATKAEVERAMKGHMLAQAELVGRYGRSGIRPR